VDLCVVHGPSLPHSVRDVSLADRLALGKRPPVGISGGRPHVSDLRELDARCEVHVLDRVNIPAGPAARLVDGAVTGAAGLARLRGGHWSHPNSRRLVAPPYQIG